MVPLGILNKPAAEKKNLVNLYIHCYGNEPLIESLQMFFNSNAGNVFRPKIPVPRVMLLPKLEDIMSAIDLRGSAQNLEDRTRIPGSIGP